jgi:hypothetical protein
MTSPVTSNLDQWVENGFINAKQRESIAQLIEYACYDAEQAGYTKGRDDLAGKGSYDLGYDDGYDAGYSNAAEENATDSFDQGYQAALTEYGIEE